MPFGGLVFRCKEEASCQESSCKNRLVMGCNGWNHDPDCDCGWGGDTGYHLSQGGMHLRTDQMLTISSFLNPNARCPVCGDPVYYYESPYGGRVFFDEIGPPWAKHPCTDNGSQNVSSFEGVLNFMDAKMSPEKAMQLAAELVRYAMTDFREPKRSWPEDSLSAARHEVLDWLFRQHTTGGEHTVPLGDFMLIVGFIEERAKSTIKSAEIFSDPILQISQEQRDQWTSWAARSQATLLAMTRLRNFYETGKGVHDNAEDGSVVSLDAHR